jgi:hypothetical protein
MVREDAEYYNDDVTTEELFDNTSEEDDVFSDVKESIVSLYKSLDFEQKEEFEYIMDNLEDVPWSWRRWVK